MRHFEHHRSKYWDRYPYITCTPTSQPWWPPLLPTNLLPSQHPLPQFQHGPQIQQSSSRSTLRFIQQQGHVDDLTPALLLAHTIRAKRRPLVTGETWWICLPVDRRQTDRHASQLGGHLGCGSYEHTTFERCGAWRGSDVSTESARENHKRQVLFQCTAPTDMEHRPPSSWFVSHLLRILLWCPPHTTEDHLAPLEGLAHRSVWELPQGTGEGGYDSGMAWHGVVVV